MFIETAVPPAGRGDEALEQAQGTRATLERVEHSRAELAVAVDPAQVAQAVEAASRRLSLRADIPGFRRGRAPRAVVERHLGRERVWREALEHLLPEAYAEAVRQTGVEPVAEPDFSDLQAEEGRPLTFRVAVDVRPRVELGDYRSLAVEVAVPEVTAAEVDAFLESLRERRARFLAEPDAGVGAGRSAWITYQGTIAGRPVDSPPVLVEFGRDRLLPGVEERLAGARAGEERDLEYTLPAEMEPQELAGGEVRLRVRVHSVGRREIPALDAEFAASLGVPGPEELRRQAENTLKQAAARRAHAEALARAVEQVVARATVEAVPASLVERRLRTLMRETGGQEPPEALRARAEEEVRTELVLEELARREGLEVGEQEVQERLDKEGLPPAAAAAVRRSLRVERALDFLRGAVLRAPAER